MGMLAFTAPAAQATPPAGGPQQNAPGQAGAQDLGPTTTSQTVTASIILKIHNQSDLAQYIQDSVTPRTPRYHKFLSVNQFVAQYAPSNGDINQVTHYLQSYGLNVNEVYQDNLVMKVTGTVDQFNNAFNTTIHDFSKDGKKFHAPKKAPKVPDALVNNILAITGLSTAQAAQSLSLSSAQMTGDPAPAVVLPKSGTATGVPGDFTVGDTANMYDINPLYQQGITGKGQTIGIATLANFAPADAYAYWDAIGLKYTPNRITQVHVDGGGDFGSAAGSGETSLDVEQSGGLAPDANIVVYDAPNTDSGFLDVFYKAVSDNIVDSLSVSWGQPEIDYVSGLNGGVDYTNELQAFDQVFMEGASQGISMFAASGDSGAYDTERGLPAPYFSTPLSVDAPASDPYMTAAGGTTVPFSANFRLGPVSISTERPWAWDYLGKLGYNVFSVGDGGGVSVLWPRPSYQQGVSGMLNSATGQSFVDNTGASPDDLYDLPANFAGRNVSDLSMDADPETGYLYDSSADGGMLAGEGGTSFVAPQLNGITALIDQDAGGRIGFLNPTLYGLMQSQGYGTSAPFNDLKDGSTNWYYQATPGYDPAAGIGTPNVANLAASIAAQSGKGKDPKH
jgi:kumamolisin